MIRDAMEKAGQIALGRVVIGTRERILALEVRGKGILAYTPSGRPPRFETPDEIFDGIADKKSPRRHAGHRREDHRATRGAVQP